MASERGIFFHSSPKLPYLTPLWKYTKHAENKNKVHMQGHSGFDVVTYA